MPFYVYILQSEKDGSYYKGYTDNPALRLTRHNNGESTYTRTKLPWKIVYLEIYANKTEALKRERALKKYSHRQIEQLIGSQKNKLPEYLGSIG